MFADMNSDADTIKAKNICVRDLWGRFWDIIPQNPRHKSRTQIEAVLLLLQVQLLLTFCQCLLLPDADKTMILLRLLAFNRLPCVKYDACR